MGINRNAVSVLQYSSTLPAAAENIYSRGTTIAEVAQTKKIFITDLKISGGATTQDVTFYVKSTSGYDYGQALTFTIASAASVNFSWEIPYRFMMAGTSGEYRHFVASSGADADIKYCLVGYIE